MDRTKGDEEQKHYISYSPIPFCYRSLANFQIKKKKFYTQKKLNEFTWTGT